MILPTRPRKPRDKAKVEACVGIVERWLLGRLRNRIFYSLAEVNAAIAECLADLNDRRVLRQFGKTRRQLFDEVDVPNLKPLPSEPWVHAEWRRCRVGLDYHIAIERHHYSVPHRFAPREAEARFTASTVEIFLGGERIAVHMRGSGNGRHTTVTMAASRWMTVRFSDVSLAIGRPTAGTATHGAWKDACEIARTQAHVPRCKRIVRPLRASTGKAVPSAAARKISYRSVAQPCIPECSCAPVPATQFFYTKRPLDRSGVDVEAELYPDTVRQFARPDRFAWDDLFLEEGIARMVRQTTLRANDKRTLRQRGYPLAG